MRPRRSLTPAPIPASSLLSGRSTKNCAKRSFANANLRRLGDLLLTISLECAPSWPNHPESDTRSELRPALADLRHLQGFLAKVEQEHIVSTLPSDDDALSRLAARAAQKLTRIADEIEQAIAPP